MRLSLSSAAMLLVTLSTVVNGQSVTPVIPTKALFRAVVVSVTTDSAHTITQSFSPSSPPQMLYPHMTHRPCDLDWVTFAWNFETNCFSEKWDDRKAADKGKDCPYARVICNGKNTTYQGSGKCKTKADNATLVEDHVGDLFNGTYTEPVGLVSDPFFVKSEKLFLWRDPSNATAAAVNKNWLWVNATTGAVVYWQEYRRDLKETYLFYVPQEGGLVEDTGVSPYDFILFKCLP